MKKKHSEREWIYRRGPFIERGLGRGSELTTRVNLLTSGARRKRIQWYNYSGFRLPLIKVSTHNQLSPQITKTQNVYIFHIHNILTHGYSPTVLTASWSRAQALLKKIRTTLKNQGRRGRFAIKFTVASRSRPTQQSCTRVPSCSSSTPPQLVWTNQRGQRGHK